VERKRKYQIRIIMLDHLDLDTVPPLCFIQDEDALKRNLSLIKELRKNAGIKIILALKAYANWHFFPLIKQYTDGATASSLNEAKLIFEEMGCRAHTYSTVYEEEDFEKILYYSNHLTFNSLTQFEKYKDKVSNNVSVGLRINPEFSQVETELYNPCTTGSRLGITSDHLKKLPKGVDGLHFHVLCESTAVDLVNVFKAVDEKFGDMLFDAKWLNMGGGHLLNSGKYDLTKLIFLCKKIKAKYDVEVILEPGSGIIWNTGVLVTRVEDIVEANGVQTLMLNTSFTAHMPDTLEMPYRPDIVGANKDGEGEHKYRIGGVSCLAGDYLEVYGFSEPVEIGHRIIFKDMMHYTTVKTNMFNGVRHPDLGVWSLEEGYRTLRSYTYKDYRRRMG